MNLLLAGVVESIGTRQDGSVKFTLATQEMSSEQAGQLFQFRNKFVKCFITDTNVTDLQAGLISSEPIVSNKVVKSPSKRLKNVMFLVHQSKGIQVEFEQWYASEMESLINQYKEALNDE